MNFAVTLVVTFIVNLAVSLIEMTAENAYSTFCSCSLIRAISFFDSMTARAISN